MNDTDYYTKLDTLLSEVMKQAGRLVFQSYGDLNEVLMETTRRKQEAARPAPPQRNRSVWNSMDGCAGDTLDY